MSASAPTCRPAETATEMPDFSRHDAIPCLLRDRGLNEEETNKVCAGNWLRVFQRVRA